MNATLARNMLNLLQLRSGKRTIVVLANRGQVIVENIAWGRDFGDEYDHVTTNSSPPKEGLDIDYFSTAEIEAILEPLTMKVLLKG